MFLDDDEYERFYEEFQKIARNQFERLSPAARVAYVSSCREHLAALQEDSITDIYLQEERDIMELYIEMFTDWESQEVGSLDKLD